MLLGEFSGWTHCQRNKHLNEALADPFNYSAMQASAKTAGIRLGRNVK
jgi:hypothetical protein